MSADPRRRRRSTLVALSSGMAVLAAIPVMTVAAWRAIRDSTAAQNVGVITSLTLPDTPTALIAGVDDTGEIATIAVIALRPEGGGGTIVSVPVGARSLGGGDTPRRLADSYAGGDVDAFVADVEGLMSATITEHAVMRADDLAALLAPLGEVEVTLASDLRDSGTVPPETSIDTVPGDTVPGDTTLVDTTPVDTTPVDTTPADTVPGDSVPIDGTVADPAVAVVVPSGTSTLDASQLAAALTARVVGEPESARLDDIGAIWDGVAASVGAGRGEPPAAEDDEPATVADMVQVLASGPIEVWKVSSSPIVDATMNPEGLDLYKVRTGEMALVMASVAPDSMIATLPGPTMQLDSSFADADASLAAVELLHFFSINVMLVREVAGDPPPVSLVRYAEVGDDEDFSFLEGIIGPFEVERIDTRVEGIDFEVVLGESFIPFLAELDFDPSTDVVPTDTPTDTTADTTTDTTTDTTATGEDG